MSEFTVQNVRLQDGERRIIAPMMQPYLHHLSAFEDLDRTPSGAYDLGPYFDAYWEEATRWPFQIQVSEDGSWRDVGFCLVRQSEGTPQSAIARYEMAEFFVLSKWQGQGIGQLAARLAFRQFEGHWRVAVLARNEMAQRFWRSVVSEYSNVQFSEVKSDAQPVGISFEFVSG